MSIFDYSEYKLFLKTTIRSLPKQGRGQARRLSEHLSVNSVAVSQVLSGSRDFTAEQALATAAFFGLDEQATEYFVTLVNQARAGTKDLRDYYAKKIAALRQENLRYKNRVVRSHELLEADK